MIKSFDIRSIALGLLVAGALCISVPEARAAQLMGTEALLEESFSADVRERVMSEVARDEVASQLAAWGVDAADVEARLAQMSQAELASLADRLDATPAGAGAVEVIGVVFLVLLILELVGVIDIFKAI